MKLSITKKHIKNGKRKTVTMCPIALALKDNGFRNLCVSYDTLYKRTKSFSGDQLSLPTVAETFIRKFDNGEKVYPFSFELSKKTLEQLSLTGFLA